jgi:hypothetical protein
MSPTELSSSSGGNTTLLSSGATAISAGPTGSPSFSVTQAGVLNASNAHVTGEVTASSGTIAGWIIGTDELKSASSGSARISLDKAKSRVAVIDSSNTTKVAMGYLEGLLKNSGTGYWGASNYGFWALQGDNIAIDGDIVYTSGDWVVEHDGSFIIKNALGGTVIKLGMEGGERGLFLFDTSGDPFMSLINTGLLCLVPGAGYKYGASNKWGGVAKYGSPIRARINNTSDAVPFYCNSSSIYGDFHYYDRGSDPTGAAEVGDTCVVSGVLKICTSAGTPGTWANV